LKEKIRELALALVTTDDDDCFKVRTNSGLTSTKCASLIFFFFLDTQIQNNIIPEREGDDYTRGSGGDDILVFPSHVIHIRSLLSTEMKDRYTNFRK